MSEFSLINRYFKDLTSNNPYLALGIGDDAAIFNIPDNKQMVASTDTLIAGVHFYADFPADGIAHKALATNLSDISAMGAKPFAVLLALSIPMIDDNWMESFCSGFSSLANKYNVSLAGGDITRGDLSITISAYGLIDKNKSIKRSNAKDGDVIYVSGNLGASTLALDYVKKDNLSNQEREILVKHLMYPDPQINEGLIIAKYANACIDISDGLTQDLGHILQASNCGAELNLASIPIHPLLNKYLSIEDALKYALTGGDDYKLCFSVAVSNQHKLEQEFKNANLEFYKIGKINKSLDFLGINGEGQKSPLDIKGYMHFK